MQYWVMFCLILSAPVFGQTGAVSLVSDYVCRGVSQGNGDPSLQANIAFELCDLTVTLEYASLSRVNKDNEFVFNIGYTWELGDVTITPTYRHHWFQSPLRSYQEFTYEELKVTFVYQDVVFDAWVDENKAFYYEGAYAHTWSRLWSTRCAVGYVDNDDPDYHLINPELNIRLEVTRTLFDNLGVTVAFSDTDNRQTLTGRRFIASLTYSF